MKLIVLDRDGVINEDSDEYVKSVEVDSHSGSLEAIARLCKAGWTVAVATNQSGVARGKFDLSTLGDMHFKMQQLVMGQGGRIDLIVHCPHGPDDGCDCRKPKPGCFAPSPSTSARPISRAFRWWVTAIAICMPACCWVASPTVRTGKGLRTLEGTLPPGTQVFDDTAAVVDHLLESSR